MLRSDRDTGAQVRHSEQPSCAGSPARSSSSTFSIMPTLLFRRAYARSYVQMTDKLPALWSYVYEQTDREIFRYTNDVRALSDAIGAWGLRRLLREYQPQRYRLYPFPAGRGAVCAQSTRPAAISHCIVC